MEALRRTLRQGGLSSAKTHHAYHSLDSHLIGFTIWQSGYAAAPDLAKRAQAFVARSRGEFPYIAEHAMELAKTAGPAGSEFAFGLDLILQSLSDLRDGTPRGRTP